MMRARRASGPKVIFRQRAGMIHDELSCHAHDANDRRARHTVILDGLMI